MPHGSTPANPACPHPAPRSTAPATAIVGAPALSFDPLAATRWLHSGSREHPGATNAEALGIDEEVVGRGLSGFLNTVDDVLAAEPAGLIRRLDVRAVLLWRVPDGDIPDQGAVITVDLTNGIRLATVHQGLKDFTDRDARGVQAAMSALAHIAAQVSALVRTYQRNNPAYQP